MNKKSLAQLVENYRNADDYSQDLLSDVFYFFQDSSWSIQQVEDACWKALNWLKGLVWNTHPAQTGMFLEEYVEELYPSTYAVRVFILASRYLEGKDDLEWERLQVKVKDGKATVSEYNPEDEGQVCVSLPNVCVHWAAEFNAAQ